MAARTKRSKPEKQTSAMDNPYPQDQPRTPVFALPDSLQCSEVSFPVLIQKRAKANWNNILEENRQRMKEIEEHDAKKNPPDLKPPFQNTACDYMEKEVFVCLLPVLEDTLRTAKIWHAMESHKCFFNGIDWIAQELWNNNPRYPARKNFKQHIFNMPWARDILAKNPRPYYPKSWLWTEDYAATLIQKTFRQYLVQRDEEVQEMREFWKKLDTEKKHPSIHLNPFLAKKFASQGHLGHLEATSHHSLQEKPEKKRKQDQDHDKKKK